MRKSGVPSQTVVCSVRNDLAERVNEFLRRRYPVKTGENVRSDIGINATTVQKWLDRSSAPSSWALVKMISAYGPEFLAAVMGDTAPAWLRQSAHVERRAQIEAQMAALSQELQGMS